MQTFIKDPDAVLDYVIDWSDWLATDETIVTSTWTVPTGITKDSNASTDTKTLIWLSGGTKLTNYAVVNHIITSAGRKEDRTINISCLNR